MTVNFRVVLGGASISDDTDGRCENTVALRLDSLAQIYEHCFSTKQVNN